MALTISPPSPAASDGSTNSASTGPPQTPVLPGLPLETPLPKGSDSSSTTTSIANSASASAGGVKRTTKPSRRANTAERRATHNAVERQRRETLNGRFLDLAALLPNLSQIRRPSKSAIVNSSIAHINASRRHRLLAAQQLRALKNESDALRHEVNEWRMRAGIPAVEEPHRADGFAVILSGELEFEAGDMMDGGEDGDEDDELSGSPVPGGAYGGVQFAPGFTEEPEEYHLQIQQQQAQQQAEMLAQQQQQHHQRQFAPQEVPQTIAIGRASQSPPHHPPHHPPHFGGPPMVAPAGAPPPFDPALAYDNHHHAHQLQQHQMMLQAHEESDKWAYHQHQQLRARQAQQQGVW